MIDPNWCRENPEEAAKQMELLAKTITHESHRIRAAAVRDAIEATRDSMVPGGERWLCHVDRLKAYADKLEAGCRAAPAEGADP